MVIYNLNEDVEKRLKEWAKKKYKNDSERILLGKLTFSDIISDVLEELGF